LNLAQKTR
jgi:hypothetical protein